MTEKPKDPRLAQELAKLEKEYPDCRPLPALERLIHALLAAGNDPDAALRAIDNMQRVFVDWNETRVARIAELSRAMSPLPDAEAKARRLRDMLRRLFDLHGSVDLSFLPQVKPTEGKQLLAGLDEELPREVIAGVLFELCPGAALSISPEALALARKRGIIPRSGTKQQLQKALLSGMEGEEATRLVQYLEFAAHAAGRKRRPATRTAAGAKAAKNKAAAKKPARTGKTSSAKSGKAKTSAGKSRKKKSKSRK